MFPIEPAWYLAICKAQELGCPGEIMSIAAIMSTQKSIFIRPRPIRNVADLTRAQFANPLSDHITHLNAFHAYIRTKDEVESPEEKEESKTVEEPKIRLKRWCLDHFLSYGVLEEVSRIRKQLKMMLEQHGLLRSTKTIRFGDPNYETNIRKALALSFFYQSAIKTDSDDMYRTIHHNVHGLIHWNSALLHRDNQWVVYDKFHMTSRQYISVVTAIEPEWIMVGYFVSAYKPFLLIVN